MLPQTRQKLRIFSLVSLGLGILALVMTWMFADPERVVPGAQLPSFWEVMLSQPSSYEDVEWTVLDTKLSYQFFSNLLRFILLLTVCTSALSLVVVYQDVRLTKK